MPLQLLVFCALSSVVEHYLHTVGVVGSKPTARTILPLDEFSTSSDHDFTQEPRDFLQSRTRFEPNIWEEKLASLEANAAFLNFDSNAAAALGAIENPQDSSQAHNLG